MVQLKPCDPQIGGSQSVERADPGFEIALIKSLAIARSGLWPASSLASLDVLVGSGHASAGLVMR